MSESLLDALEDLRPQLTEAAQRVYDRWNQDGEGVCPEYGMGGICEVIADAFISVICDHVDDVETKHGTAVDQDHTFAVVKRDGECYDVDIPFYIYETVTEDQTWLKVSDVEFTIDDIFIEPGEWDEE